MKYILTLSITLLLSKNAFCQLGIGTSNPEGTLHIEKNVNTDIPDGIIAPRLSGDDLKIRDSKYTGTQNAAIVYVTSKTTIPEAKTIDVTSPGYYYYDSNSAKWISMKGATNNVAYTGSSSVILNGNSFERSALTGDATTSQNSNSTRVTALQGTPLSSTPPSSGQMLEYDGTQWKPTNNPYTNIKKLYRGQMIIPPHSTVADWTGFSNTSADFRSNNWYIESKKSIGSTSSSPAKMEIVYEYQGTAFSLDNVTVQLVAQNLPDEPYNVSRSFTPIDTFSVTFNEIWTHTNGKTRIRVIVARTDMYQIPVNTDGSNATDWAGIFRLNILVMNF
ncbi:hypothetical protein [Chryseobacterium phocaeense]|uniref:hypothetical protein n=1 Tax=Chryseobacterium phocaeense TaxID=1816690 RepID=UPI0009BA3224|nr:hypothetical protein [Chryseobacterium phocaeense]